MTPNKSCNSVIPLIRKAIPQYWSETKGGHLWRWWGQHMTETVRIIYSEVRISVQRLRKTIKILIRKNDTSHNSNLAPPTYKLHFYCYTGNFLFCFKRQHSHHTSDGVCITTKCYNLPLSAKNANATATPVSSNLRFLNIWLQLWVRNV